MKRDSGVTIEYAPGQQEPGRIVLEPGLERLSQWMDTRFQIPGLEWRFGLDALLGLVPVLGDVVSALIGMYIVSAAARHGVSRVTLARMGMNLAIDFVLGTVPLAGDLFDVAWKANQKNVELLRRSLSISPTERRKARRGDWLFVAGMLLLLLLLLAGCVALGWVAVDWLQGVPRPSK